MKAKVAAEHELVTAAADRESTAKSRDWHKEQMSSAQESRQVLQRQLMGLQKQVTAKDQALEAGRRESAQLRETLEAEREVALKAGYIFVHDFSGVQKGNVHHFSICFPSPFDKCHDITNIHKD